MSRLTGYNTDGGLIVREEERLLCSNGIVTKDEMYKIMHHLAEKLAEYEDLEEQSKLLKLPCAVGDTVYQLMFVKVDEVRKKPVCEVFKAKVFKFSLDSYTLCFWTETVDEKKIKKEIPLSAFGITVFSTKPEAELALQKMNEMEELL